MWMLWPYRATSESDFETSAKRFSVQVLDVAI